MVVQPILPRKIYAYFVMFLDVLLIRGVLSLYVCGHHLLLPEESASIGYGCCQSISSLYVATAEQNLNKAISSS